MSDDATAPKVTPSQALLVFSLVARHGEAAQAEMRPEVKKPNRDALVAAKLIGVRKVGRGLQITLEDAGWAWAGAHLGTVELPPVNRAMQDLLARLGAYLKRSDETLAGFIGSKPTAGAVDPPTKKPAFGRDALERAYLDVTGGRKGVAARLAEVRARLGDVPREDVDHVLAAIMLNPGKSRLMPIEDRRAVTEADRQTALNFKGSDYHVLWIEP